MSDQLLDQLVDRAAYTSDKEFVEGILGSIFKDFKQVENLKIKLNTDNSFQAVNDTVKKVKKSQDELSISVKAYQTILDNTAKNQAKFNAGTSEAAKLAADSRVALQKQNAEITANAKVQAAANGSIDEARALVKSLQIQRDALSSSDANYRTKVDEINAAIDQQNAFIDKNTSKLEKQKNNVGNYIGAISILKPALDKAAASLSELTKQGVTSGAAYESLQKEVNLLTVVVDKQEAGFSSLNRELRANREALQTMRAAGLAGTEAFKALSKQVNAAQDDFDDFREAQALLGKGGEAPVIALVDALQGLAGIYGATVAAQEIFGQQNEQLAESMKKLQAILVLLNSLQQISATLGKAEAIAAGLQAGARAALTAVTRVYTFVTEGATLATKTLRAALVATGIGAVVILLISFVNELSKATSGTNAAREAQQKYNETLKEYYDTLSKNNDEFLKYQGLNKKALEEQLEQLNAQGASYRELQAVKLAIAAEDEKNAKDALENLGLNKNDVESLRDSYNRLGDELLAYEKIRADAAKKAADAGDNPDKDRGVIRATSFIKSLNASRDALLAQIEPAEKQLEIIQKSGQSTKTLTDELNKYNKEQAANLAFNTAKVRLDRTVAANAAIVANERNTQAERVEAIRQGAKAEEALELANLARQNATPGKSKEERIQDAQNTAAAIQKINVAATLQELTLTRAYAETDYQARLSILKQEAADEIAKNQVIIDNEKATFDQRIAANTDNYNKRRAIATADYFNILHDQTTSEDQRKAALAKYNSDVLAADIQFNQNAMSIRRENADKLLADGIAANEQQIAQIKARYAQAQIALNAQREAGLISDAKYARLRADQDEKFADEQLQVEITTAYLKVNATKIGTKERADAEQELYDKIAKLTDNQVKHVQDAEKKKQEAVQKTVNTISKIYGDVTDIIGKALDAQITNQKNAIQEQIQAVSDKAKSDIDAENATLDSAQVKADKIAVIQAKAQADTEALQLRQKKLDIEKAKFDKIKAIGSIILDTARAVAADLLNPAKIPFDIALGAAELAIAIAAPVPTYYAGTRTDAGHPGGLAIVGDGGRSELVELPDGSMYVTPSHNTLVDMPEGAHVYPDAQKMLAGIHASVLYSPSSSTNGLAKVMVQQTNRTIKAIQDKEELHINPNFSSIMAIHKYGNSYVRRIDERIQF
jgi:hypothetical protein